MRKIFILIAFIAIQNFCFGQFSGPEVLKPMGPEQAIDRAAMMKHFKQSPQKSEAVGWLIPSWNLLDYYYAGGAAVTHYANLIMPDSTVLYESSGTIQHHWLMGVGGVLDPYSPMFDSSQNVAPIDDGYDYTVDSVFVLAWYTKVNSGTDTLIAEIEFGTPTFAPEFGHTIYTFTPDTFHMSPPKVYGDPEQFGYKCRMTAPSKQVIKYVLGPQDSTNNLGKYITFPVGLNVTGNKVVGLSLSFVPGQPYSFGDMGYSYSGTETQTVNSFRVGLYSTDDVNADPHIFVDPYAGYSATNYLRKEVRYTMYTGSNSWRNDRMTSSVSWAFDIGYYVSKDSLSSVPENQKELANIFPNPVQNGMLNIITSEKGTSEIQILTLNGQSVMNIRSDKQTNRIDLSALKPGIYMARIFTETGVITKKIVIE
ncbi:MAG: T9SS type A sorting domain-containing protein [Bacteroidota bacterium]